MTLFNPHTIYLLLGIIDYFIYHHRYMSQVFSEYSAIFSEYLRHIYHYYIP